MGTAAGRFPGRDDGEALTPSPSPLLNHTSSAPSGCWREVTESTYRRPRPKKDDCEERPPQGTTSSRRVAGGKREERLQGTYDVSYRKYDIHDCWYAHALYRRHGFLRAQHYEGGRDGGGGGGGGGGGRLPRRWSYAYDCHLQLCPGMALLTQQRRRRRKPSLSPSSSLSSYLALWFWGLRTW